MTVIEVEQKRTQLEAEMQTALTAAKVLVPATPEFDEAYSRYLNAKAGIAKIPDEIAKAKLAENAEAINAAGATVAEAIAQLVEGLKVAELIGSPVIALRYYRTVSKDEAGNEKVSTGVAFNPVTQLKAKGAPKEAKGHGRTIIIAPDGSKLSPTKFVLQSRTKEETDAAAAKEHDYPHTFVDTKPKFDAWCVAHNLTGYIYEVPAS